MNVSIELVSSSACALKARKAFMEKNAEKRLSDIMTILIVVALVVKCTIKLCCPSHSFCALEICSSDTHGVRMRS